jgi:hypothetical protein
VGQDAGTTGAASAASRDAPRHWLQSCAAAATGNAAHNKTTMTRMACLVLWGDDSRLRINLTRQIGVIRVICGCVSA